MGGVIIVILLLLLGGCGAWFYFMNKPGNASSGGPVCVNTMPERPTATESWSGMETLHQSDDFIPQDTVYSYYNPTPGINCPNCDAENPSEQRFCTVCGATLNKYT